MVSVGRSLFPQSPGSNHLRLAINALARGHSGAAEVHHLMMPSAPGETQEGRDTRPARQVANQARLTGILLQREWYTSSTGVPSLSHSAASLYNTAVRIPRLEQAFS